MGNHFAVKANDTQDEHTKLQDDEIVAQVRTLMLAGHETVSKTVSGSHAHFHGTAFGDPLFVADIYVMGTRKVARDPAKAAERGYRCVRDGEGARR